MIPASSLIEQARALTGVPYVHQGHTEFGVDCCGLIYVAALRAGLDFANVSAIRQLQLKRPWSYGREVSGQLLDQVRQAMQPTSEPVPGCILLFRFSGETLPRHMGIFTGESIVHANGRVGRVIEHGYRAQWVAWTHSRWLLPEVIYGA